MGIQLERLYVCPADFSNTDLITTFNEPNDLKKVK